MHDQRGAAGTTDFLAAAPLRQLLYHHLLRQSPVINTIALHWSGPKRSRTQVPHHVRDRVRKGLFTAGASSPHCRKELMSRPGVTLQSCRLLAVG